MLYKYNPATEQVLLFVYPPSACDVRVLQQSWCVVCRQRREGLAVKMRTAIGAEMMFLMQQSFSPERHLKRLDFSAMLKGRQTTPRLSLLTLPFLLKRSGWMVDDGKSSLQCVVGVKGEKRVFTTAAVCLPATVFHSASRE